MGMRFTITEQERRDIRGKYNLDESIEGFIKLNSDLFNLLSSNGMASKSIEKVLNRCKTNKNSKTTYTNNIADLLSNSMTGLGTDENGVYNALKKVRTSDELCGVSQSYEERNGESLWRALDGDFDTQKEWVEISKIISDMLTNEKENLNNKNKTTNKPAKLGGLREQYSEDGELDINKLAKKIVLSQKFSEVLGQMEPSDYSDEFEFGDNFLSELLDDYVDSDFYDDLYDVVKMEYGDTILNMYLSNGGQSGLM